jgi:hypothetical protein
MLGTLGSDSSKRQLQIDRQISRVNISVKDMQHCLEFTSAWNASLDEVLQRALITAAVISYTRPFSGNEEHPRATGKPLFSPNDLTQEEQRLHKRLCDVRDQAIAHSDVSMSSSRPISYPGNRGVVMATKMYDPLTEAPKMQDIHSLATKVDKLLTSKLYELAAKRRQELPATATDPE